MEDKTIILSVKEKAIEKENEKAQTQTSISQDEKLDKIDTCKQNHLQQAKVSKEEKTFNAFSSASYKSDLSLNLEKAENEIDQKEETEPKSSIIIEKPNYDFIEPLSEAESQKIFKISRKEKSQQKNKSFGKKLRIALFSIILGTCGVWGITNTILINKYQAELNFVTQEYIVNLPKYLQNLANLDAVNKNNMENLFPLIPEEEVKPTTIVKQTNWFDRICEFLVGLFGG